MGLQANATSPMEFIDLQLDHLALTQDEEMVFEVPSHHANQGLSLNPWLGQT